MTQQVITELTKPYRKVQTVDGATFRLLSTSHHDETDELMAQVIDENGEAWTFYAVELRLK